MVSEHELHPALAAHSAGWLSQEEPVPCKNMGSELHSTRVAAADSENDVQGGQQSEDESA